MPHDGTISTRVRDADYLFIRETADKNRLDIVDFFTALRKRWEASTQKQRREAIEQVPPRRPRGRAAQLLNSAA